MSLVKKVFIPNIDKGFLHTQGDKVIMTPKVQEQIISVMLQQRPREFINLMIRGSEEAFSGALLEANSGADEGQLAPVINLMLRRAATLMAERHFEIIRELEEDYMEESYRYEQAPEYHETEDSL